MKTSDAAMQMIAELEGITRDKYTDSVGVYTIGVGHTAAAGDPDPKKVDHSLTNDEIVTILRGDAAAVEKSVAKYAPWADQNQFDALVSFTFNLGSGNLLKLTKNRTAAQVATAITLYNQAGGHALDGLTKRRAREQKLFLTGDHENTGKAMVYPVVNLKPVYSKGVPVNLFGTPATTLPAPVQNAPTPVPEAPVAHGWFETILSLLFGVHW